MAAGDTLKTYSGDGVTTDFAIPFAYDDATTEVVVTRAGGAVTYTFPNAATIRLTSPAALAVGDTLTIQRVTNIDNPKVVFKNGSGTTGVQLNSMVTQLIRSAQEVKDLYINALQLVSGVWDAGSKRIVNLATPTTSTDAATKAYVDAKAIAAGNVVAPVLAEVGYWLKATAVGTWAWTALNITSSLITDATTAGRALLTAVDAAAQRTALGLGSLATKSTITNSDITAATITGASIASGTVTSTNIQNGTVAAIDMASNTLTFAQFQRTGTAGQVWTSGGAGADASYTTPPFSKTFTSTDQTITSGGLLTLAHGMGVKPTLVMGFLKCTTAENGYSIGDIVPCALGIMEAYASAQPFRPTEYDDTTNVYIRYGSGAAAPFSLAHKTTGAYTNLTNANWSFFVRAWA